MKYLPNLPNFFKKRKSPKKVKDNIGTLDGKSIGYTPQSVIFQKYSTSKHGSNAPFTHSHSYSNNKGGRKTKRRKSRRRM
jgi:hypothetical protein